MEEALFVNGQITIVRAQKNGQEATFVHNGDQVGVVALTKNSQVLLERTYYLATDRNELHLPVVNSTHQELPQLALQRLLEQYHLKPTKITFFGTVSPYSAFFSGQIHLYVATQVQRNNVELEAYSLEGLQSLWQNGEMYDSTSLYAIQSISSRLYDFL